MRVPTLHARLAPRGAGTPHPGRGRFQPRGPSGKGARPVVVLSWSPVVERPRGGDGYPPSSAGRRQDETTTGQQVAPRPSSGKGAAWRRRGIPKGRSVSGAMGLIGVSSPARKRNSDEWNPSANAPGFRSVANGASVASASCQWPRTTGRRGDKTTRNRPQWPLEPGDQTHVSPSSCRRAGGARRRAPRPRRGGRRASGGGGRDGPRGRGGVALRARHSPEIPGRLEAENRAARQPVSNPVRAGGKRRWPLESAGR